MALTVAVQMDHISRINIAGDSTFAIMLEGQRRGHRLHHLTPDRVSLENGRVTAAIEAVEVRDKKGDHFTLSAPERRDLSEMDVVLLRQDPPFDMAYIANTHLLERLGPKTLVVNDPVHVRNAPEKVFVTYFPDLMPPTVITRDPGEIRAFRKEHGDIIVKPLNGNGGAGIFRLAAGDQNLNALLEMFASAFREPYVIQRYIPAVRQGDKRIILVDGEAVGAINRVPSDEETRSNLHVGGRAEPAELTTRDREICARLGPELRARGFVFVGIDVIGDYLTEINVTSPTGIRELRRFGGADAAALIWDAIEGKAGQ